MGLNSKGQTLQTKRVKSLNQTHLTTRSFVFVPTVARRSVALKAGNQGAHNDEQDVSLINTISELSSEKKGSTGDEDDELEKSFRTLLPSESHLKKSRLETRGDHSLLYMNDMSQTSFSQLEPSQPSVRLSFEGDSFKKFTGEIVKKYMQEEEMRSKHQAHLLKLREKVKARRYSKRISSVVLLFYCLLEQFCEV